MIEYNPYDWHSTKLRRGYVYLMKYHEIRTIQLLAGIKIRVCDRRFYTRRSRRGDKWYWGWIAFVEPLPLWEAMNAGLVPIFKLGREVR